MPEDEVNKNKRKRIVVEEVSQTEEPLEEIKEKAQEIEQLADAVSDSQQTDPIPPEAVETLPTPKPSSGINPLVIVVPGIFLLGGLVGGILFYQNRVTNTNLPQATDSPTLAPSEQVEPTPTPASESLDLTKYKINVLNGSGIAGEAGKAQKLIEDAGFNVSSTGNAPTYDFTKTVIQAKAGVEEAFITKLSEALSESYSVDSNVASLSASSKDSVVVIVGSTKK